MVSIHTIAHVRPVTLAQIANTKSTSVTQAHVKMEEPVPITVMTIHAIVHTDSLEKTAPNMQIGVHKIRVKMVLHAHNEKTPTNVAAYQAGLGNCVTLKWYPVKMLPFAKESV